MYSLVCQNKIRDPFKEAPRTSQHYGSEGFKVGPYLDPLGLSRNKIPNLICP